LSEPTKYFCPNCKNTNALIEIPVEVHGKLIIDLHTQTQVRLTVVKEAGVVVPIFAEALCLSCGHRNGLDFFTVGYNPGYSDGDIVVDLRDHKTKKITSVREGMVSFDEPPLVFTSIKNIRTSTRTELKEYKHG
jgi:hypothetical protein